ncbi:MAG: hypothetical protein ACSLFP_01885 [Acidimicrobiales bacterium]
MFGRPRRGMLSLALAVPLLLAACQPAPLLYEPGTARPITCDPTDTEINDGHHGDTTFMSVYTEPKGALSADDCRALDEQTTAAREFVAQFPTVADAEAAGWVEVAVWSPGQGVHYADLSRLTGPFDPERPNWLMYDGNMPMSRLTGMMYLVDSGPLPPAGFQGDNDHWHRHGELCTTVKDGHFFIASEHATDEECAALGGTNITYDTQWMLHVWMPFYDGWIPTDVFNRSHPSLGDGHMLDPG